MENILSIFLLLTLVLGLCSSLKYRWIYHKTIQNDNLPDYLHRFRLNEIKKLLNSDIRKAKEYLEISDQELKKFKMYVKLEEVFITLFKCLLCTLIIWLFF